MGRRRCSWVVHVVLARRSGGSAVRIELHRDEPDLDEAEDIVEVSLEVSEGGLSWESGPASRATHSTFLRAHIGFALARVAGMPVRPASSPRASSTGTRSSSGARRQPTTGSSKSGVRMPRTGTPNGAAAAELDGRPPLARQAAAFASVESGDCWRRTRSTLRSRLASMGGYGPRRAAAARPRSVAGPRAGCHGEGLVGAGRCRLRLDGRGDRPIRDFGTRR